MHGSECVEAVKKKRGREKDMWTVVCTYSVCMYVCMYISAIDGSGYQAGLQGKGEEWYVDRIEDGLLESTEGNWRRFSPITLQKKKNQSVTPCHVDLGGSKGDKVRMRRASLIKYRTNNVLSRMMDLQLIIKSLSNVSRAMILLRSISLLVLVDQTGPAHDSILSLSFLLVNYIRSKSRSLNQSSLSKKKKQKEKKKSTQRAHTGRLLEKKKVESVLATSNSIRTGFEKYRPG